MLQICIGTSLVCLQSSVMSPHIILLIARYLFPSEVMKILLNLAARGYGCQYVETDLCGHNVSNIDHTTVQVSMRQTLTMWMNISDDFGREYTAAAKQKWQNCVYMISDFCYSCRNEIASIIWTTRELNKFTMGLYNENSGYTIDIFYNWAPFITDKNGFISKETLY